MLWAVSPYVGGSLCCGLEGAYFAKHLEQARQEGRICRVSVDPMLPVKAFFDIGGAGSKSDAMAIWLCQFVGREIRLLDYIEGIGWRRDERPRGSHWSA
jgi:phage terminase large subunit